MGGISPNAARLSNVPPEHKPVRAWMRGWDVAKRWITVVRRSPCSEAKRQDEQREPCRIQ